MTFQFFPISPMFARRPPDNLTIIVSYVKKKKGTRNPTEPYQPFCKHLASPFS